MTRLQFKKCDHDTNTLFEQKQVHSKYGCEDNEICKNVFVEKSHKKYKPFSENELAKMFCRVAQGKFVVNIVECHNSKCDSRNRPSINQAVPCTGCKQNSEVSEIQIENQQNCYTQNTDLSENPTSTDSKRNIYDRTKPHPRVFKKCNTQLKRQFTDKTPLIVRTEEGTIDIQIGGLKYSALIDTGAHISVISENVVKQNPYLNKLKKYSPQVFQANTASLTNPISFEYSTFPKVRIGTYTFMTQLHVTVAIKPEIILGVPFLKEMYAHIDFTHSEMVMTLNNGLYTPNRVVIPPMKRVYLKCKPYSHKIQTGFIMACPLIKTGKQTLVLGHETMFPVSQTSDTSFSIPVTNLSDKQVVVPKNSCVGYFQSVELVQKQSQEQSLKQTLTDNDLTDQNTAINVQVLSKQQKQFLKRAPPHCAPKQDKSDYPPIEHDLSTSTHLTEDQKKQLRALLLKYDSVFLHENEPLGVTHVTEQRLRIGQNQPPVWRCRPLRLNNTRLEIMNECIKDLLAQDIIAPSDSLYLSSVVLVKKPNGTHRICLDSRTLNKHIPDIPLHPRPLNDILGSIAPNSSYHTSLDLTKAYWQIPLAKEDRKYTAFQGPTGIYEFTRMSMGVKSSGASLIHLINQVFHDMINTEVQFYLDDAAVSTVTFEKHLEILEKTFTRLQKANLKLNPHKCSFCVPEIQFLGHRLNKDGLLPSRDKVETLKKFPTPKTPKQLKSFLGLSSFFRKFQHSYCKTAAPLYNLLKKDVKFQWTTACEEAFQKLKHLLCNAPILKLPQESKPFHIYTDGSKLGLGFVLAQEFDGKLHPIAYGGKSLNKHQKNYTTTEIETLALVSAVHHFQFFIQGNTVICHSDHAALKHLATQQLKDCKVSRWLHTLNQYNVHIAFTKGKLNLAADSLSRIPISDQMDSIPFSDVTEEFIEKYFDKYCAPTSKNITETISKKSVFTNRQIPSVHNSATNKNHCTPNTC